MGRQVSPGGHFTLNALLNAHGIAHDDRILHLKTTTFPQFRFEWHPGVERVFIVRVGVEPLIGEPFAFDIKTEGDAWNATLIFLRGYRAAQIWKESTNGQG